jgi:PAS domain S-box-containing protein
MASSVKKWSIETKVLGGFALGLGVLLLTAALSYRATMAFLEANSAAARSVQALAALDSILSNMNEAESRQRGYLILTDDADLGPRAEAIVRLPRIVNELREHLADNPAQLARLPELSLLIERRIQLLDWVLEARRTQGFAAARERLRVEPGRHEMRAMQEHVNLMINEETALLERRRAAVRAQGNYTLLAYALSLALSLTFLTVLFRHIRQEIRERHAAEEALARHAQRLREQESRLRAILDTAADAIIVIDEQGRIDRFNPAAERMFGYTRDEAIGRNVSLLMPSPHREAHDGYLARYLETGERHIIGYGREVTGLRKNGEEFPLEVAVSEIRLEGRRLFTGIMRDISERRQRQEELAHLVHDLEAANDELRSFAYVVSHDLKAPLRAIGSLTDWIAADYKDKLNDEGREHLRLLTGRVRRMDALIDGILEYSRVGRIREARVPVDMNRLAQETLELLAPPPHIRITVAGPLPAVTGERTRLQQLLQNLLGNAIKYMDKTEGDVRVGCEPDGDFWRFHVADNGPGIEPRHHERIFQLFQTLAPRDRIEGTGVGLALVKKIVELYGGRVWVESQPGKGATFYFTLPRSQDNTASAAGRGQ